MSVMTAPAASRAARALGLASASVLCFLAASALGITVLGKVYRPEIVMDLAPPPPAHKAATPHEAAASVPPPVAIAARPMPCSSLARFTSRMSVERPAIHSSASSSVEAISNIGETRD